MENLTEGQLLVGLKFNPSKDSLVDRVKQLHSEIIDVLIATQPVDAWASKMRDSAIMHEVDSCMKAVKLLTWS